jgi:SAM-dependent methyltransferase
VFLIEHLEAGNYVGMDYNESFVRAARHQIAARGLEHKRPRIEWVLDFDLDLGDDRVDWILAFSVLNHCNDELKARCLDMIERVLGESGTAVITHARWYDDRFLTGRPLTLRRAIEADMLDPSLRPAAWGWEDESQVFPILELTRA